MRRAALLSAAVLLVAFTRAETTAPTFAQGFGEAVRPGPNFRAGTTLVEFTVVVTDADGRHVTDLTREDVSILEGGQPRDVAFFHYEGAQPAAIRVRHEPLPPGIYTNRPEYAPGPPRNLIAILIDSLNTRAEDQVKVLAHILAFVSAVPSDTRVAIYRTGERVHVVHDFTDDIEGLRKRLLKGGLEAVGNHLAGIPGRKNLIWMTSGVPAISAETRNPWPQNYIAPLRRVAQKLASQGIAMYPVEAAGVRPLYLNVNAAVRDSTRGVEDSASAGNDAIARTAARVEARQTARGAPRSPSQMSTAPDAPRMHGTMDLFADLTGGRALRNTNDLLAGIKAAAHDMRGTYSVGFYAPQDADERWHTFSLKVRRPGVKVVHRQGYLSSAAAKQSELWLADQWRAAANNPLGSATMRLDARFELKGKRFAAILQIPAEDLGYRPLNGTTACTLEIAIAERTPAGLLGIRHELG
ncbi:MAG TPA: VWA domain-containing protein, partial [Vicinamibacterales bacterium]|nr:VWA domain-containing protein [Vicinamibacterales bacterium]